MKKKGSEERCEPKNLRKIEKIKMKKEEANEKARKKENSGAITTVTNCSNRESANGERRRK